MRLSLITRFSIALILIATATSLFAAPPPVVNMTARIIERPEGTKLEVRITPLAEQVTKGIIEVTSEGDAATINESTNIAAEVGMTRRLVYDVSPGISDLGIINIRYLVAGMDGAVAVVNVPVENASASVRQIKTADYEARLSDRKLRERVAAAEQFAAQRVDALLAEGKHPAVVAPGEGKTLSVEEEAWNRAASRVPADRAKILCGVFSPSGNNSTYPVYGNIAYYSQYNGQTIYLKQPGYSFGLSTTVEYTDGCGNYQYLTQNYNGSTGYSGSFYLGSVTSYTPPTGSPIDEIRVSAAEVGTVSGGGQPQYINYIEHLGRTTFSWTWYGSYGVLNEVMNQSNSLYPFFYMWEDEIKKVRSDWQVYGFYYTFTAAYDGNDNSNANVYFQEYATYYGRDSYVHFGNLGRWSSPWIAAHELGHQFQFRLQGGYTIGFGQTHSVCQVIQADNAFKEGFADWHANREETDGRSTFFYCPGGDCTSCGTGGWRIEGNVQAFFTDVFDTYNDPVNDQGLDTVYFSPGILRNWNMTGYGDFDAFYSDFRTKGLWDPYLSVTDQLRVIDYVSQP